jgi:hypothetical protein
MDFTEFVQWKVSGKFSPHGRSHDNRRIIATCKLTRDQ